MVIRETKIVGALYAVGGILPACSDAAMGQGAGNTTRYVVPAGGFGVCKGEGCTAPCPAENACLSDADCSAGMICGPGCAPSICGCNATNNTWGCTRDCNGVCVPNPIPTVSHWGIVVMTLLVLTTGTVVLIRRRPDPGRKTIRSP